MGDVVNFRLPSGDLAVMEHGEIIGRLPSADLQLDDPHISEAHAMLSQRSQGLTLLALRGTLFLGGGASPQQEIVLKRGQRIRLTDDIVLSVEGVVRDSGAPAGETTVRSAIEPLRVVCRQDTVEISRPDLLVPLVIRGRQAAVLQLLVQFSEPVRWYRVARVVWPRPSAQRVDDHKALVRRRWDTTLRRLRAALKSGGIRRELLDTSGGLVSLVRWHADEVIVEE